MGHPDILFANHGITGLKIGPMGNIQDISLDLFEGIWRLHTGTSFRVSRGCITPRVSQLNLDTAHPAVPPAHGVPEMGAFDLHLEVCIPVVSL